MCVCANVFANSTDQSAISATASSAESLSVQPTNMSSGAQSAGVVKAPLEIGSGRHLLSVILGLAAIVIFILFLSWFVKRFSLGTFSANTHLKVVASLPLGTRERLLVVDVAGQQILLGISAAGINNLHLLDSPIVKVADSSSDFSQKLMAVLQQKNTIDEATVDDGKKNPLTKGSL
jgi:flagellar protein FliO/FliZ